MSQARRKVSPLNDNLILCVLWKILHDIYSIYILPNISKVMPCTPRSRPELDIALYVESDGNETTQPPAMFTNDLLGVLAGHHKRRKQRSKLSRWSGASAV